VRIISKQGLPVEAMMMQHDKRILIVEDDEDIRHLLADLFTDEGYRIDEASDGAEALVKMHQRHYDVVLSDYHMPRIDGGTLLQVVRLFSPDCPVILTSCDPEFTELSNNGHFHEAFACLSKPFELEQLLRTVHEATNSIRASALQGTA
jgi:DNA-binding NtrC family response regulator